MPDFRWQGEDILTVEGDRKPLYVLVNQDQPRLGLACLTDRTFPIRPDSQGEAAREIAHMARLDPRSLTCSYTRRRTFGKDPNSGFGVNDHGIVLLGRIRQVDPKLLGVRKALQRAFHLQNAAGNVRGYLLADRRDDRLAASATTT